MVSTRKTIRTTCKVGACEPFCGLEVDVEEGRMVGVRPNPDHPVTKGHACVKGMAVAEYQNDPDRLLHPIRRDGEGWTTISWEIAVAEIGARLSRIRERHGPRSIATYWGNACDSTAIALTSAFTASFGSPNSFNVLSLEYTDRGAIAQRMFGDENLILQPDAGNARLAVIAGANPVVTQGMSLLQRRPRVVADLKAIQARGGRVVVIDPRSSETARIADEHLAIRPGTDLFLFVAMIRRILETGSHDVDFLRRHVESSGEDLVSWKRLVTTLQPEEAASITGIPVGRILGLADEFAATKPAFITTRVGVQTSHNTTLTEWAVTTLNALTGNIDRAGGVYFNPGFVDVPGLIARFSRGRDHSASRIGGFPQVFGGPPATTMADDILSDDPQRIRALVVIGGNPVITFPNTRKMEAALRRLDLLVCIDIYRSDTGAFAHYNLPATTGFEKGSYHFLTSTTEPFPYAEWKPAVVTPRGEARTEWDIFRDLAHGSGRPFLNDRMLDRLDRWLRAFGSGLREEHLFGYVLFPRTSLRRLRESRRGLQRGDIRWGEFLRSGLRTPDGRIRLAPPDLVPALVEALGRPPAVDEHYPLMLISGGRRAAAYNSWTHNLPTLARDLGGNWLTLSVEDASRFGVREGDWVRVSSPTGSLEIEARVSDRIREGVVMIHQFWGHQYDSGTRTSRRNPGVNVNLLHDDRVRDPFTGMPVFNGTKCSVKVLSRRTSC